MAEPAVAGPFTLRGSGRVAGLVVLVLLAGGLAGAGDRPPNIVLFYTDDQRWDTLGTMPAVSAELVDKGLLFSNSFVNLSSCCPARATLLTGDYAHTHGVLTNQPPFGGVERLDARSTIATWLDDAGYTTAYFGKYLNGYFRISPEVPPGWDVWRVFASDLLQELHRGQYYAYVLNEDGSHVYYGQEPHEYSTDVLRAMALEFIESREGEPFFMVFAPYSPHLPAIPAERHVGVLGDLGLFEPPNFLEADLSDKPEWVQFLGPLIRESFTGDMRANQLESLLAVDEAVAAIVDALARSGALADSLLVYASDNGYLWGEHSLVQKGAPYEESMRVPLVMRFDGRIAPGSRSSALVSNTDLAPTFADLAGVDPLPQTDGKSLRPLLDGGAGSVREALLGEFWQQDPNLFIPLHSYWMVRTAQWKYVRHRDFEDTTVFEELYDLARDPYELDNVLVTEPGNAQNARRVAELSRTLEVLLAPEPSGRSSAALAAACVVVLATRRRAGRRPGPCAPRRRVEEPAWAA